MALRVLTAKLGRAQRTAVHNQAFPSLASFRGFASDEQADLIVLGGGPGGYVGAIKAGQLGLKVTCIEGRGRLGGTCLNVGCIPSKALLHSSHLWHEIKNSSKYGITVGDVKLDLGGMMKQKDDAVMGLTSGIEGLFKKNKVTYVKGWGKLTGKGEVTVELEGGGQQKVTGKNIMLATGSNSSNLPGIEVDEERIVSSTGVLELKEVPKKMIVIGGGYIGLEMASVWARLGSEVTVVEYLPDIVSTMDREVAKNFQRALTKQGLKWKLGHKCSKAEREGDIVKLHVENAKSGKQEVLEANIVLVAAGRGPVTVGIGLEELGVELTKRNKVVVDKKFKTNVDGIYAIGDIIDGPMLAHKAEEDGIACVENLAGKAGHVNYDTVPLIIYTDPEVASVGKTEEQVKEMGIEYNVGKFSFMANSRARAIGHGEGLVKFVSDAKTDKILGCHIMGPGAGELIPEVVLAMEYGGCTEDIARACHGHPTMSEAIKEAALATYDKPIHM